MENILLVIVSLVIGYSFKKLNFFSTDFALMLNKFVIYISLPSLILLQIPKIEISFEMVIPGVISWSVMIASIIAVLIGSKIFKFTKEVTGVLLLVCVLGNSLFVGLPIIQAYLGNESLPYVLLYDQLGTFFALVTYGTFITAYYSKEGEMNLTIVLKKMFFFPPFLALLVALLISNFQTPIIVEKVLEVFALTIVPLALIAVGLQLELKISKEDLKPFFFALFVKLIYSPIVAIIICYIFAWDSLAAKVSILEAAMPTMATAVAYISLAKLPVKLGTAVVGYGIVLSLFTTFIVFNLI